MKLRLYNNLDSISKEDLEYIKSLYINDIIEFLNDPFTFNIGVIYNNDGDKIIGVGVIRVVNEFKMVVDPDISNISKAKVIQTLLRTALEESQCNEILVEISKGGYHYIDMLIKHFNFYETSGPVLRLEK